MGTPLRKADGTGRLDGSIGDVPGVQAPSVTMVASVAPSYDQMHSDAWNRGVGDTAHQAYYEGYKEDAFDTATGRWVLLDVSDRDFYLVDPTVIDGGAIGAYTNGGCGYLAQHLSDMPGFTGDVVVVYDDDPGDDYRGEIGGDPRVLFSSHVAAIREDGAVVDIEGVHDLAEFSSRWGDNAVVMPAGEMADSLFLLVESVGPDAGVGYAYRAPEVYEVNAEMANTVHRTYGSVPITRRK